MTTTVVVAAKRTPFGRFLGGLADSTAVDLACLASEPLFRDVDRTQIDSVIVGNVLSAGQGMNIAHQVVVRLGMPLHVPAFTVNMMCASGLQAVLLADQAIQSGNARAVLCGGTESMSNAPYLLPKARRGHKFGDGTVVDSMLHDGLIDSFDHIHMGVSVETLASEYGVSRQSQDQYAFQSQDRYAKALVGHRFEAEIVPVGEITRDEHPRRDTTIEKLTTLKPAFGSTGTVTAGNASGINDGAAMLVLAERAFAEKQQWPILATLAGGAVQGCDPMRMGLGPVHAIRKLCGLRGWNLDEFDTIEINEAFAVQTLACQNELRIHPDRLNVDGGAIAIGHPIGASGARLAVHLVHRIQAGVTTRGMASLCVGGGMGIAAAFTK